LGAVAPLSAEILLAGPAARAFGRSRHTGRRAGDFFDFVARANSRHRYANVYAFVTDKNTRSGDEHLNVALRLVAERAAQNLAPCEPIQEYNAEVGCTCEDAPTGKQCPPGRPPVVRKLEQDEKAPRDEEETGKQFEPAVP
jgi:hypothetical protein